MTSSRRRYEWRTTPDAPKVVALVDGDHAVSFTLVPLNADGLRVLTESHAATVVDERGDAWWVTDIHNHTRTEQPPAGDDLQRCPVLADWCAADAVEGASLAVAQWRAAGGTDEAMWALLGELLDDHMGVCEQCHRPRCPECKVCPLCAGDGHDEGCSHEGEEYTPEQRAAIDALNIAEADTRPPVERGSAPC